VIFFLLPDLDYTIRQRLRCQERSVRLVQTPAVRHFRGNAPQFNSPSAPRCKAAQERVDFKKGRMPYVMRMQRARLNVFHQTDTKDQSVGSTTTQGFWFSPKPFDANEDDQRNQQPNYDEGSR